MDDIKDSVSWNPSLEKLIAEEGEKASGLSWIHSECEKYYSKMNQVIAIPVICLSTVNGFVSGAIPTGSGIGIGAVSLFTALLSTIGAFYSFAKRTETHRITAIQYLKFHKFISIEMSLPLSERMDAKDMLKVVREQTDRLLEISPIVPDHIKNAFQEKIKGTTIAVPESANGVHQIEINHHRTAQSPIFTLPTEKSEPFLSS